MLSIADIQPIISEAKDLAAEISIEWDSVDEDLELIALLGRKLEACGETIATFASNAADALDSHNARMAQIDNHWGGKTAPAGCAFGPTNAAPAA